MIIFRTIVGWSIICTEECSGEILSGKPLRKALEMMYALRHCIWKCLFEKFTKYYLACKKENNKSIYELKET